MLPRSTLLACLLAAFPLALAQQSSPSAPTDGAPAAPPTESPPVESPPATSSPVGSSVEGGAPSETSSSSAGPSATDSGAEPVPQVQCFAPDGETVANASYAPCNRLGINQSGIFSSCCRLEEAPESRELCAATGLCLDKGIVRRGFCTDKTWDNPACVNVCVAETWGGSINGSLEMTPCTDGTFCCGHNNLTCCGTKWAITVPTLIMDPETITETANPDAAPPVGAYAGLAAAIVVVLLLSLGTIYWLLRRFKMLKKQHDELLAKSNSSEGGYGSSGEDVHRQSRIASYQPGSSATTTAAGSTHVPSMQEFAQFKAMYGAMMASNTVSELGEPGHPRVSELDGFVGLERGGALGITSPPLPGQVATPPPPPPQAMGFQFHEHHGNYSDEQQPAPPPKSPQRGMTT